MDKQARFTMAVVGVVVGSAAIVALFASNPDHEPAEPRPNTNPYVWVHHDVERGVTCWLRGAAISCLPDKDLGGR